MSCSWAECHGAACLALTLTIPHSTCTSGASLQSTRCSALGRVACLMRPSLILFLGACVVCVWMCVWMCVRIRISVGKYVPVANYSPFSPTYPASNYSRFMPAYQHYCPALQTPGLGPQPRKVQKSAGQTAAGGAGKGEIQETPALMIRLNKDRLPIGSTFL